MSSKNLKTRNRILNATWKLLEANQSADVRMSDIAKRAGVSRQAVYLHFANRTDLLIATTKYIDEVKGVNDRLVASRTAKGGLERLEAFVDAWCNYIPEVYSILKALRAVKETDDAAMRAWDDRMQAVWQGCEAAVKALKADDVLKTEYAIDDASDILWTLLSVYNWEQLTIECGWAQEKYVDYVLNIAKQVMVK